LRKIFAKPISIWEKHAKMDKPECVEKKIQKFSHDVFAFLRTPLTVAEIVASVIPTSKKQ